MGLAPAVALLLLAPAAPLPGPPAPAKPPADPDHALLFAGRVLELAAHVQGGYVRPIEMADLLEGAARGLHDAAGAPCPDEVRQAVRRAAPNQRGDALATVRANLGDTPALAGPRALFAAVHGFRYATDQYTALVGARTSEYASVEMDCGIGMELEGVTAARWTLYETERGFATGQIPGDPAVGAVKVPTLPVSYPWRVARVIPGSPCQKGGLRPGDVVTHVDGRAVTAESSPELFRELAAAQLSAVPELGGRSNRVLTVRRPGAAGPVAVRVRGTAYAPETVFGVLRVGDDGWDHMLDREAKIGYVRLGWVENFTDERLSAAFADLNGRGCRGLIVDLRWCPGGFVTPTVQIASLFLPDGAVVSRMTAHDYRTGETTETTARAHAPSGWATFADRPVVVLVGPDTAGGGEMIAAALREHGSSVVVAGGRTVGKGNVQNLTPAMIGDLRLKVTTGYALRPDGTNRHRFPTSKPADDWGVRPDPGFEVPATADFLRELKQAADLHALRPAGSVEALAFDDPAKDPHRLLALQYLRKKLGRAGK